jgi:trans-aconitate 2-methyltransferase
VGDPRFYYSLLAPDTQALDIRETEYLHVLHGPDPIKEWTKGTSLAPLLERLEPEDRCAFEEDYARRLRAAYPPLADGTTLFPFRRLFIVATRR